jgi:hypothetical protein
MPVSTRRTSISLMEIVGGYSAGLVIAAIIIGVIALIARRQKISIFSACAIFGIALAGLGATFWNLTDMNMDQLFGLVEVHPSQWLANFCVSCARAGAVLPACGIAFVLVGISFLFPKKTKEIANKTLVATGDNVSS